jgi:hypothetical protein
MPEGDDAGDGGEAAMAITTDTPVARGVLDEILGLDGFVDARSVEVGRAGQPASV